MAIRVEASKTFGPERGWNSSSSCSCRCIVLPSPRFCRRRHHAVAPSDALLYFSQTQSLPPFSPPERRSRPVKARRRQVRQHDGRHILVSDDVLVRRRTSVACFGFLSSFFVHRGKKEKRKRGVRAIFFSMPRALALSLSCSFSFSCLFLLRRRPSSTRFSFGGREAKSSLFFYLFCSRAARRGGEFLKRDNKEALKPFFLSLETIKRRNKKRCSPLPSPPRLRRRRPACASPRRSPSGPRRHSSSGG